MLNELFLLNLMKGITDMSLDTNNNLSEKEKKAKEKEELKIQISINSSSFIFCKKLLYIKLKIYYTNKQEKYIKKMNI